jgi:hypothetical protein
MAIFFITALPEPRTISPSGEGKARFQASLARNVKGKAVESLKRRKLRTLSPEKLIS